MCGIAGIIYKDKNKQVRDETISLMLSAIWHRGPDGHGSFINGNVGIGMQRLSIIDTLDHEIPYFTADRKMAIVYNGEIYNHTAIRAGLKNKESIAYGSDTETALYAMYEKGVGAACEFNGMYAFATYEIDTGKIILIRDKSGEKPLYYYEDDEKILFASEIKAILTVIEPQLNKNEINYRAFEICCGRETLFRNIYCLEPGSYVEIVNGRLIEKSYWKVWDYIIDVPDSEEKIINDLTELIEDAILLRKNNNAHQTGCLVSGGVDSALVACISNPDFIYTGNYDISKNYDELQYAELVAKKIGRKLNVIKPTKENYLAYQEEIIYHLDMPSTWTSFNLYMVLKRASKDVKVILSGEGVDELFGGYHRYHLLNHDQKIYELDAMQEYSYLINKYYGSLESRYAKLINRNANQFDEEVNQHVLNTTSNYFNKIDGLISGMGLTDFFTSMQILLTMTDRTSMAFHIENRSPFLDHRIVQYAFSMPDKYKIQDGITKSIIKKIARKFIPIEIVERIDKRGFVAPVNQWFNWSKNGQYDRQGYRDSVFNLWEKIFIDEWPSYYKKKLRPQAQEQQRYF